MPAGDDSVQNQYSMTSEDVLHTTNQIFTSSTSWLSDTARAVLQKLEKKNIPDSSNSEEIDQSESRNDTVGSDGVNCVTESSSRHDSSMKPVDVEAEECEEKDDTENDQNVSSENEWRETMSVGEHRITGAVDGEQQMSMPSADQDAEVEERDDVDDEEDEDDDVSSERNKKVIGDNTTEGDEDREDGGEEESAVEDGEGVGEGEEVDSVDGEEEEEDRDGDGDMDGEGVRDEDSRHTAKRNEEEYGEDCSSTVDGINPGIDNDDEQSLERESSAVAGDMDGDASVPADDNENEYCNSNDEGEEEE